MRRVTSVVRSLVAILGVGLIANCSDAPTAPERSTPAIAPAIGQAATGETIITDKDDYAPGETIVITGSGWQPGDSVDFVMTEEPATHEPHTWTVGVDESGGFVDDHLVVQDHDLGVIFTLTATSRATGATATAVFTDASVKVKSNLDGVTFTATVYQYSASGCVAGNLTSTSSQTIDVGGSNFTVQGPSGSSQPKSIKFKASATSDQGAPFGMPGSPALYWTASSTTGVTYVAGSDEICVSGNNGNTLTANYDAAPDLELTKSAGAFSVGSSGTYTIVVTNAGNATASGGAGNPITVTDILPVGLTPPVGFNEDNFSCTVTGQTVTCELAPGQSIAPSGTRTIHVAVGVTAAACSSVNNSATVSGGNEPAGNVGAENTGSTSTNIAGCNTGPTAEAGGPYSGNEGSAIPLSGASASGTATPLTYKWTYAAVSGVDAGATCSFSPNDTSLNPSITCDDDGTFEVTLTVTDADNLDATDKATLTVSNVAPTADAGGPYSGNEGSAIALSGSGDDPGDNDDDPKLTYLWTVDNTGIDAGGACTLTNATQKNASVKCTDDSNGGTFTLTLVVTDDDGESSAGADVTLTVGNLAPAAIPGGPYSGNEGSAISLSGSGDDPGDNDDAHLTFQWTVDVTGIDALGACTFDDATKKNAKVTCTDDSNGGIFTLTLVVTDDDGGSSTGADVTLTVANLPPVITSLILPVAPVPVNTPVEMSATFTDPGKNDTHVASVNWEATTTGGTVTESDGAGSVSASYTYSAAGIYTIVLTVTDDDLASDTETFQYVVVYDPSAGFVTGGGWINSLAGMYLLEPSLTGKANFGFVSKYLKGATTPTGNTEFQFHAGNLNFSSTSYEWLVVNGSSKAIYKGVGTVNGGGDYGFLLSVIDGGTTGDKFRMKIWDRTTSTTIYDNQVGAGDNAEATTQIAGGSIVIHTGKK